MSDVKNKKSGMHDGHRDRLRKKYRDKGLDYFEDHEILEMLLYYAVPRRDTNPLAHDLLDHFGSLSGLMDANYSALKKFGLSDNVATFIKFIPDITRVYLEDKKKVRSQHVYPETFCSYFRNKFVGRTKETLYALLLDMEYRVLYCGILSTGSISSTDVPVKTLVEWCLLYDAQNVVISHNHPHTISMPSPADLETTKSLRTALASINVALVDHIIVSDTEETSMARCNLGKGIFR